MPLSSSAPPPPRLIFGLSVQGLVWLGFYGAVLSAWLAVALMGATRPGADLPADLASTIWQSLCLSAAEANPVSLWIMWALMASAMMLPTFAPALRTFGHMGDVGASSGASMAMLTLGYLCVWLAASVAGAGLQILLGQAGLLSPLGGSLSKWLTAALLLIAGGYQFSVFRAACLAKCRMPMTFFMQYWRPGAGAAYGMGLRLGALCLGCCWALMLLGFVGGTMNLIWMGAATLFMTLEKLPDIGRYLTRPMGFALLAAGLYTLTI